jgi:hypothetical protein
MRLLDHEEDQATLVAFDIGRDGVSHDDDDDGDNGGGIAAAGGTSWGNKAGSEVVRANSLASSHAVCFSITDSPSVRAKHGRRATCW